MEYKNLIIVNYCTFVVLSHDKTTSDKITVD